MYLMTIKKEVVSWTIDKEIIEKINFEAKENNRSKSFIANKYLNKVMEFK